MCVHYNILNCVFCYICLYCGIHLVGIDLVGVATLWELTLWELI